MTTTKHAFEQKRIDNIQWLGVSGLSNLPSLPKDGKSPALKTPLFYLVSVSVNSYENDIYFINNTDETLSFVAPFMLYRNLDDAGANLDDVNDNNMHNVKLYGDNIDRLYTDVLPKQGVRIDRMHIIYDSDYLIQHFIHIPFKGLNTHYGIWRFNVVEKGGVSKPYPLLWDNFSKPTHMVKSEYLFEPDNMPIVPTVYEERCLVLEELIRSLGIPNAISVLAINDVLYRYCVGWSAPYSESDIQAKDIAYKLQALTSKDVEAVKDIVQAVYDFWFGKDFAKDMPLQACTEIYALYHTWLANKNAL